MYSPAKNRNKHQGIAWGFVWEERNYFSIMDINLHRRECCWMLPVSLLIPLFASTDMQSHPHATAQYHAGNEHDITMLEAGIFHSPRKGWRMYPSPKRFECMKRLIIPLIWPKSSHKNNSTRPWRGAKPHKRNLLWVCNFCRPKWINIYAFSISQTCVWHKFFILVCFPDTRNCPKLASQDPVW